MSGTFWYVYASDETRLHFNFKAKLPIRELGKVQNKGRYKISDSASVF